MRVEMLLGTGGVRAYQKGDVAGTILPKMIGRDRWQARGRPDG
jgi:hypothetical protein